jgi:hypothetical protein
MELDTGRFRISSGLSWVYSQLSYPPLSMSDAFVDLSPAVKIRKFIQNPKQEAGIKIEDWQDTKQCLTVIFNEVPESKRKLEYWSTDSYNFFAKTQDEMQADYLILWETGILKFRRDGEGQVVGISWEFCKDEYPIEFERVK